MRHQQSYNDNIARTSNNKQNEQKQVQATSTATRILNDLIDAAPNMKVVNGELKKKRGRKINGFVLFTYYKNIVLVQVGWGGWLVY